MALIYLLFVASLAIIILDYKSLPSDKKLTAWNKGRIKMILGSWTLMLGSSVPIIYHLIFWIRH